MKMLSEVSLTQKILIIDGHPVYINKLDGFLKGLTFSNIVLAKTGQEGIFLIENEKPALVILSGKLPDMDALEVCKTIRRSASPAIKIIVQIGLFADEGTSLSFKKSGADIVIDRREKDMQPLQEAIEYFLTN